MKFFIETPVGHLALSFDDNAALNKIDFVAKTKKTTETKLFNKEIQLVVGQLNTYFKDHTFKFSVPLGIEGTASQKRVWQALLKIPAGKTVTYSELARQLKTGARAVGNACKANPLPIIIPCHRVVAKQGLGGYAGKRLGSFFAIKKWLLEHEKASI